MLKSLVLWFASCNIWIFKRIRFEAVVVVEFLPVLNGRMRHHSYEKLTALCAAVRRTTWPVAAPRWSPVGSDGLGNGPEQLNINAGEIGSSSLFGSSF